MARYSIKKLRTHIAMLTIAIIVCVVCLVTTIVFNGLMTDQLDALRLENFNLSEEVTSLTKERIYTESDAYVERVARDELDMIREGEYRYVSSGY